jgi:hypothetical protein
MIDRIKEYKLKIQISPLVEMTGGKSEGPIEGFSLCWSCEQLTITPFLVGDNLPTVGRIQQGRKLMAKAILLFANFFTALKHGAIPGKDHGFEILTGARLHRVPIYD